MNFKRILVLVLTLTMLMSTFAPTISILAAEVHELEHENESNEKHYVSIGDSMTNGYGFDGYEQGQSSHDFFNGEGTYGAGAYPLQFEEYLKNKGYDVTHTKLAVSALRAEDLLYLLGGRDEAADDWFKEIENYSGKSYAELAPYFQNAVKDADVMTLGIGNASFGAFMLSRVTNALNIMGGDLTPEQSEMYTLENALSIVDDESEKETVREIYASVYEKLYSSVSPEIAEQYKLDKVSEIMAYVSAGFIFNFAKSVDKIVELNEKENLDIILVGLMNTTYGMVIELEDGSHFPFGDVMDEIFYILNDYIVLYPTLKQSEGKLQGATFYYAEQPNPLFIVQAYDDIANAGWTNVDCGAEDCGTSGHVCAEGEGRLSADIVRARTIKSYNESLRPMISEGFVAGINAGIRAGMLQGWQQNFNVSGMSEADFMELLKQYGYYDAYQAELNSGLLTDYKGFLPDITLDDVKAYETNVPSKWNVEYFWTDSVDVKNLAVSVYLGLEDAIVKSVSVDVIPLEGLITLATDITSVFDGFAPSIDSPVAVRNDLADFFSSEDILPLVKIYAIFKIGDGMCVHPTPAGHDNLSKKVIEAYECEEGIPASVVLEKMYDVYTHAEEYGIIGEFSELALLEEIYEALDEAKYITDEQTLDIILYTYNKISDGEISNEDAGSIGKHTYEALVRNPLITASERVGIVGTVYTILKTNGYFAENIVEELYNALDAEELITDEQSYAIVDYVYEVISDGAVTNEELLETVIFTYKVLVKNETPVALLAMRSATAATASAKTLRVVVEVLSNNYLNEENKVSIEKLITGEGALINDELLVKIVDGIVAEAENNGVGADFTEKASGLAIEAVRNDPNTDDATKLEIAGEITQMAENNGLVEEDSALMEGLDVLVKIYDKLDAEGLLSEKEVMQIVKVVYNTLVSSEELEGEAVINMIIDINEIIFGRDDLTLEQKADIVVIVYETLDEEGYITEENAMIVAGLVAEYYDEAYFEAYKYLNENGYIDVAVVGVNEAITAIHLAIAEVEGGLLGVTDELKAELVKELYATIETLEELKEVLANDSAKDVEGLAAAVLALEDDLYTHLNNIYGILAQAGIDANQLVILPALQEALHIIETEVIPAALAAVEAFVDAVVDYVQEKVEYYYGVAYDYVVEMLVKLHIYAEEKLNNAVAPLVNAYLEILEAVDGAVEVANKVFAHLLLINEKLDGALTNAMGEVAKLFGTLYEIYGNVEDALAAAEEILNTIIETAEETADKVIAAYNALVETLVEIYGTVEEAIDVANKIYNDVVNTVVKVNGEVENAIKEALDLYNMIINTLANTYNNVENVIVVAGQIFGYLGDFFSEALNPEALAGMLKDLANIIVEAYGDTKDAYYVASKIYEYFVNIDLEAHKEIINGALQGNYELTDDSTYVALGNALYAEELASMLHLNDKFFQFKLGDDYAEKVAGADLVTIKLDNGEAYEFAVRQLMALVDSSVEAVELEWNKYLDAEGQEALEKVLEAIRADLIANGVASKLLTEVDGVGLTEEYVAGMLVYVIENTLYAYAEFVERLTVTLENVTTLAPEATVVLTGIENPIVELEFSFANVDIDLTQYAAIADGVVGALNVQLFAAALVNENVIFVNSNEAADIYDALNVCCDHVYDNCEDTECNRCGATREALEHSFTNYVANNDATCVKNGTETAVCDNCGEKHTREIADSKTAHTYDNDCDTDCNVCGEQRTTEHKYGEWETVNKATYTKEGLKQRTCAVCGHVETEVLPKLFPWFAVVIGAVVVAGGIGAAVYFLVIKKKKNA